VVERWTLLAAYATVAIAAVATWLVALRAVPPFARWAAAARCRLEDPLLRVLALVPVVLVQSWTGFAGVVFASFRAGAIPHLARHVTVADAGDKLQERSTGS